MVTFLVARVAAGPVGFAAELVLGPASALFRRQLDALGAVAEAGATMARQAARLDSGIAGALVGLAAVVVVSFLVAGLVALAGPARPRPADAQA